MFVVERAFVCANARLFFVVVERALIFSERTYICFLNAPRAFVVNARFCCLNAR